MLDTDIFGQLQTAPSRKVKLTLKLLQKYAKSFLPSIHKNRALIFVVKAAPAKIKGQVKCQVAFRKWSIGYQAV